MMGKNLLYLRTYKLLPKAKQTPKCFIRTEDNFQHPENVEKHEKEKLKHRHISTNVWILCSVYTFWCNVSMYHNKTDKI